jgi:hypothetical protein
LPFTLLVILQRPPAFLAGVFDVAVALDLCRPVPQRGTGHAFASGFLCASALRLPYFTTKVKKLFNVCVCPFNVVVNDKL